MSNPRRPPDFDAFWNEIDAELARYDAAPELERLVLRSTPFATVYATRLTSAGPYRIFGYYSVPQGEGPFPALLVMPNYGSVNHLPHYHDRERYATLVLMHRGQRGADTPFQAAYPGLLTHNIAEPARYIYRMIAADCLRGAEFLLGRPEVDRNRVAVSGGDLALITAARRPQFAAAQVGGLLFYRALEAAAQTASYPLEEFNDYLRSFPQHQHAVARSLAYFDPLHHAPHITAEVLLQVGDAQTVGGPEWLAPLADAFARPAQRYQLTHEGGTDRDWVDGWLANQLGAEPRPLLWDAAR